MTSPPDGYGAALPTEGDVTDVRVAFDLPRANEPATNSASARISRVTAYGNVIQAVISPDAKFTAYVTSDQGQPTLMVRELVNQWISGSVDEQDRWLSKFSG